jgi:hypothetical protein
MANDRTRGVEDKEPIGRPMDEDPSNADEFDDDDDDDEFDEDDDESAEQEV